MTVDVAVNGVPVVLHKDPATVVTSRELSAICGSDENTVSAYFGGGPGGFSISVFRRDVNGTISGLCSTKGTKPAQKTLVFPGRRVDLEGSGDEPIVALDAADRDEISGLVARLRALLVNGDTTNALELLAEKINRRADQVGLSKAAATNSQRATLEALIEHQAEIEPLPGDLQFHIVRDGHEVLVCRPDGRGPIIALTPNVEISVRPSFARTTAGWMIVR